MKLRFLISLSSLAACVFMANSALAQVDYTDHTSGTPGDTKTSTEKAVTPADDAAITKRLKHMISQNKTLAKLPVEITTNKGVVMLSGTVDADTEETTLIEYAESITGVTDVDVSKLSVKSGSQPVADAIITAKIKGLFIREKLFGEKDIAAITTSVETKDGVVYLSGIVDNQQQIDNAIEIIKKAIPDVKKVEYNIQKVTTVK